jgi:hypothetical protein
MKQILAYFVLFLFLSSLHSGLPRYSPKYDFASDPVFAYIRKSPTRGVILAGLVQSYEGLNVQTATGKQYWVPTSVMSIYRESPFRLHCYDNSNMSYIEFVAKIVDCFENRNKQEWLLIGEALGSNLVLTLKDINISVLNRVAENDSFYLYEIKP